MKDYKNYTIEDYKKAIYGIMRNNTNAKTLEDRTAVINKYNNDNGLIVNLTMASNRMERVNNSMRIPNNRFRNLMLKVQDWILSGKAKIPKDYYAGSKFNDTPSEINDNMKTSNRVYQGKSNYYKDNDCIRDEKTMDPKDFKNKYKNELDNPYIQRIYKSLTDREAQLRRNLGDRFKISRAIHDDRQNLKEAMNSYHGQNQTGRTDNTVSPKNNLNLPKLTNRTYVKELLRHHLDEINDRGMRDDKITLNDRIGEKSVILKMLERGYRESEIARTIGTSQANVSKRIKRTVNKLTA